MGEEMKANDLKTSDKEMIAYDLKKPWERLIYFVTADICKEEPFDTKTFAKGMRDTFEYFFPKDAETHELTKSEISLFGSIYAYTRLPNLYSDENHDDFKKSQFAANILSFIILFRDKKDDYISGSKLYTYLFDSEDKSFKTYEYDLATDDMGVFRD